MPGLDDLMQIDIKNLILNENAYFYKIEGEFGQGDIIRMFNEAIRSKDTAKREFQRIIRRSFKIGGKEIAKFSIDIFKFKSKPPFFKEDVPQKFEIKYGIFIIIEHAGYAAVIKKYVSGVDSLYQHFTPVDYEIMAHFLITQESKFEKIISSNMNSADTAIQVRYQEAKDLKMIYSRFGASKHIINSMRLDTGGAKHTISLNTSRVNSLKVKSTIESIIKWACSTIDLIEAAYEELPESKFVDSFAVPLEFEDAIEYLTPTFLLLRFWKLKEDIENGKIVRCYHKTEDGEIDVDLINLISENESLFDLQSIADNRYGTEELEIRINDKSITLSHFLFKEIYLEYGDEYVMTINQFLNNGNHFIVYFDEVDHVYSHRQIFKDSRLLGDTDNFLSVFLPFAELDNMESEKGEDVIAAQDTEFPVGSLFRFIEDRYKPNSDVLICDDMGVEWCDFISIQDESLTFIHAKYDEDSLSASNLQIVFGQAQKNFGFLQISEEQINYREHKWTQNYPASSIPRILKVPAGGDPIAVIKSVSEQVTANPNHKRNIVLIINSISKQELSEHIEQLKQGNDFDHRGVTLQILWFVNALLSSSNELGTDLRIFCRP